MTRLAAALLALTLAACQPAPPQVARVVDGDTVVLTDGRRARLTGFDAPEIYGKCQHERDLAQKAKRFLEDSVRQNAVRFTDTGEKDHFGRTLLHASMKGTPLADVMIGNGLAVRFPLGRRPNWCAV